MRRLSAGEKGEDSPRRATEKRKGSGFGVQEWELAAFPNPEPLCLLLVPTAFSCR